MILAEKIMHLRKKNGWSQEELAEQLNISRQSVSKWESAQSIPDLNKILMMSDLFGVSTDYLLKDSEEEPVQSKEPKMDTAPINSDTRFVSMEEANRFLDAKELTAPRIALGVSLCILSPIPLILLDAFTESFGTLSEAMVGGIGVTVLLLTVAAAVALFLSCRTHTAEFDYLDKEPLETAYGVISMTRELQNNYRERYNRGNMLGVILCVLSAVPLMLSAWLAELLGQEELVVCSGLCLTITMVAIAVYGFLSVGIIWESYQKLMQEGDYSRKCKARKKASSALDEAYWPLVLVIYILYSFRSGNWHLSWLIWPIAAPLRSLIYQIIKR